MFALRFFRVGRKAIAVASDGPLRCQLWETNDCYRPRLKWGAAIFRVVSELGARRMTEDKNFTTREQAIAWLEQERTSMIELKFKAQGRVQRPDGI